MLTLRTAIGLTQSGLAEYLGVSRRAIGDWEAGNNYPTPDHLKHFIDLVVNQRAFTPGHEEEQIRELWRAAHQKVLLDEAWLASLLPQSEPQPQQHPSQPKTQDNASTTGSNALSRNLTATPRTSWGNALTVPNFYGRAWETTMLAQWVVEEGCRTVSVLGIGGIGKSALAVNLMHQVAANFETVIWRSVRDVPSCEGLIEECLQVLAPEALAEVREVGEGQTSTSLDGHINLLLKQLYGTRTLLVLDNVESLLDEGERTGHMRVGYEGYGRLLRRIAESEHQSCLLLTSREKPEDLASLEGGTSPVRALRLSRLGTKACAQLLAEKGVEGTEPEQAQLIEQYGGNPLALKIVAQTIVDLFDGDAGEFQNEGQVIYGGVRDLLAQQFNRLSAAQQSIMYWLAILREPSTLDEIQSHMFVPVPRVWLLDGIEALHRHSLVESGGESGSGASKRGSFTLQSVVLEYVSDRLVTDFAREIEVGQPDLLNQYAILLATGRDYVRQSQERLIGQPILQRLVATGGAGGAETRLLSLLEGWRGRPHEEQGYGPGNAVNLLRLLRGDMRRLDLSDLFIRQAYLQGVEAQDASLAGAYLSEAVLGEPFTYPNSVALTAEGAFLVAGTSTGEVRLWRAADRTPLLAVQGHTGFIYRLAVSEDGRLLASAGDDGTVRLWEAPSGRLLATLQGHTGAVYGVALSGDGHLVATGGHDGTVRLWEAPRGQPLAILQGHSGAVHGVSLSKDGMLLASGGSDGTARLWEVPSGQPLATLQGHAGAVYAVSLSGDGQLLATGSLDGTVRLWEALSGQPLVTLQGHSGGVVGVALSGDGRLLASGGFDEMIRLWEVPSGRLLAALQGHAGGVYDVALSGDGRLLASASDDRTARLWEVPSGRLLATLQGHTSGVRDVALSEEGQLLASGGLDGTVRLWEAGSGRALAALQGHTGMVRGVAFSGDGRLLASGSDDRTARLWEVPSGQLLATLHGHTGTVRGLAFSGNGRLLATGSWDRTVRLWEVPSGRLLATLQGHTGAVWGVALSVDGRLLASGGLDGTVRLWEVPNGRLLATLQGHSAMVSSVALSGDGELLASGNQDGTVRLWEVPSGRPLVTLEGHRNAVYSVALSADGGLLASGSIDGTVKLWEAPSGRLLRTLGEHSSAVWGVALSGDGGLLASGSIDGTLRLWETSSGTLLRVLRADRRYERVDITGLTGVTEAQRTALQALGAVEAGVD
jgi:WD40 repeat protein/transcriptional regulator with XRE-family HTH domain